MKKIKAFIFAIVISSASFAQDFDIGQLLDVGTHDANVLAKPYLNPLGEMLGKGLNSGWYTSAKTHKLFGFDLTLTATYIMAPKSAETFDVSKYESKLEDFELVPDSPTSAPTIAGDMSNSDIPQLRVQGDATNTTAVTMPNGSGLNYFATPMVTVGFGLPYGIELKGRFCPELDFDDVGKFKLWGLGVQKEIKEYIPGIKHVPFLNLSVLAGYTTFAGSAEVEYDGSYGTLDMNSNAFTGRLLIGANFPVICFYGGVGYGNASSDFDVLGTFNVNGADVDNPIAVSMKNGGLDGNIGFRLRFGVIALHGEYNLGEYSAVTAGLGVNFR